MANGVRSQNPKVPTNPDASRKRRGMQDDDLDTKVDVNVSPTRRKRGMFSGTGSGSAFGQSRIRNPYSPRSGGMKVGA